jgi:hypothetical protein
LNFQIIKVYSMLSRVRYAPLLLVLLFLFSLSPGCTLGQTPKNDGGPAASVTSGGSTGSFEDITSRNPPKVSLDAAMGTLNVAEREGDIDTRGMTLRQVFGYGVDSSGLARSWVLGMERGGKTTLLAYSEGEWRALDMEVPLPEGEVKIRELLTPEDLFRNRKNADLIVQEMNRLRVNEADLTISGETYQVTLHAPTDGKTFTFNGKTGELTQSA